MNSKEEQTNSEAPNLENDSSIKISFSKLVASELVCSSLEFIVFVNP